MTDPPLRPARILVVDDDPDDIHLLSAALGRIGTAPTVTSAPSGDEALRRLLDTQALPDLVLLDLKMRGMTGFEVLDAIRGHPRLAGLRVVVLSGSERDADRTEAIARGADAYLVKPSGTLALAELAKTLERTWLHGVRHDTGRHPPPKRP